MLELSLEIYYTYVLHSFCQNTVAKVFYSNYYDVCCMLVVDIETLHILH